MIIHLTFSILILNFSDKYYSDHKLVLNFLKFSIYFDLKKSNSLFFWIIELLVPLCE